MAYAIGFVLAVGLAVFAGAVGFDRDRAYYPVLLVVVASYYVLFAVMGGSMRTVIGECTAMGAFVCVALVGFKINSWLVTVGLAAHGIFDLLHARIIMNSAVPAWWPAFCLSFDVAAAACLALLQRRSKTLHV